MKRLTVPDPDLRRVYNKVFYGEQAGDTVTGALTRALQDIAAEIDRHPYCELHIEVQDGRPVMVQVTSKHKPAKPAPTTHS